MRDLTYSLKQQYFKLLTGLTFAGAAVPVYDTIVPAGAVGPYVIFSGTTVNISGDTSNTNYQFSVTVLLDVFTSYLGDAGGSSDAALISGKIKQLICPGRPMDAKPINMTPFFKVVVTKHLSDTAMNTQNGTARSVRNLIRFQHIVEELA